jgi:polygalacturonase
VTEAQLKADFDEARTDTARIQKALDGCEPGKAVELRVDGDRNLFVSGPLDLRKGVTLLVDKVVTLYASRGPARLEILMASIPAIRST